MTDSRTAHTGHNLNVHTENYLKTIWNLSRLSDDPRRRVQNSQIAQWLHIKRPTVTEMLGRLSEMGLVDLVARKGVRLSAKGEKLVLGVLRRHRLIELFLQKTLKLSSLQAHEEAEVLEHAVTPELCAYIEKYLGDPDYDLHGMPIPKVVSRKTALRKNVIKAAQLKPGQWGRVSACPDYDQSAYKKVMEKGIQVGLELQRKDLPATGRNQAKKGGSALVSKRLAYEFLTKKGKLYCLSRNEAELVQLQVRPITINTNSK